MDVLLIDDDAREWLIQVKRRAGATAVEGVETVRSLLGTMIVEGKPRGVVVTTADHFSHFAHKAAVRATARSKGLITDIQLLDRHLFATLVGAVIPTDGWLRPLRDGLVCRPDNVETLALHCESLLRRTARQLELF
jgi:restriction system protein